MSLPSFSFIVIFFHPANFDEITLLVVLLGTIAALLQEIVSIYPVINPPNLTVSLSSQQHRPW